MGLQTQLYIIHLGKRVPFLLMELGMFMFMMRMVMWFKILQEYQQTNKLQPILTTLTIKLFLKLSKGIRQQHILMIQWEM